jgi:hypothetical protein
VPEAILFTGAADGSDAGIVGLTVALFCRALTAVLACLDGVALRGFCGVFGVIPLGVADL